MNDIFNKIDSLPNSVILAFLIFFTILIILIKVMLYNANINSFEDLINFIKPNKFK